MNKKPIVTITMEDGKTMRIELYPEVAPNTVNNFISLVKSGFYNGLGFHRIIDGFMIQGGDPLGTGTGGCGYTIGGEFAENNFLLNTLGHEPGVISMARAMDMNSAGSQFFICVADDAFLNGSYAAFGKTADDESLQAAIAISKVATNVMHKPKTPQVMKTVTVETFGVEYPEPVKYRAF